MLTDIERARRVKKRTAVLKAERRRRKHIFYDTICAAACFLLVIGIGGAFADALSVSSSSDIIIGESGAAGIIAENPSIGYIIIAILAFLLGITVTTLLFRVKSFNEREKREGRNDEDDED